MRILYARPSIMAGIAVASAFQIASVISAVSTVLRSVDQVSGRAI